MQPLGEPALRPAPGTDRHDEGADPSEVLTGWLAEVGTAGDLQPRLLRLADGRLLTLPVARWAGPVDDADETMLRRCAGPVLDVGCGPGRLTAALHEQGCDVLGLEIVDDIPVLVRDAGAPLLLGDVFGPVPRAGQWQTVLLADGNIGIGGDVPRLLGRLEELLAPAGCLVCELQPGAVPAPGPVRLEALGGASEWFPWTLMGMMGLPAAASAAGLTVAESWSAGGRDFASLVRR